MVGAESATKKRAQRNKKSAENPSGELTVNLTNALEALADDADEDLPHLLDWN